MTLLHRGVDGTVFRTYFPGITHLKVKLRGPSEHMCLCKSLST